MRDRLEDLLIGPVRLARLLVEVPVGRARLLEQALDVAQQRRLTLVGRIEIPRERDLVDAEA